MSYKWQINGVVLPRNPTNINITHDSTNAQYVKMADGTERRITPPVMLTGGQLDLEWQFADRRIQNAVMSALNQAVLAASASGAISKILIDGQQPQVEIWAYLESPTVQYSGQRVKSGNANDLIVDTRFGQGGVRKDITLTGRTDGPYLHAHYPIPTNTPSVASVSAWWGGPTGNNTMDGLPTWNGRPWQAAPALASGSANVAIAFTNMGTAPWNPVIRFNGPFNTGMTLTAAYQDVDGTGDGVVFTYTGPNVNSGDYLLFDTQKLRLKSSVAGAVNEIYTFSVQTVSSNTPFPYWPPAPPGNFNLTWNIAGGTQGTSALDLSNNGTEAFRYWA